MAKQLPVSVEAEITEALGNSIFRARLVSGHEVTAHLSGKIRLNSIRILPGDKVTMEMSVYDTDKARIVRRLGSKPKAVE
jgi:translation initiation factor IF-1